MMVGKSILSIDQGTTSSRAVLFDAPLEEWQAWVSGNFPDLSSARLRGARRGADPPKLIPSAMRQAVKGRGPCPGHCRYQHHQSAGDHGSLGRGHRHPRVQCHRLAVPPHCP